MLPRASDRSDLSSRCVYAAPAAGAMAASLHAQQWIL